MSSELYDRVGGLEFFERLVDEFYRGVVTDEVLWPLYPDHSDLDGAKRRLALFLAHYWAASRPISRNGATLACV